MKQIFQKMGLCIDCQSHPADYLGVNIKKLPEGACVFLQLALIESTQKDIGMSLSHMFNCVPMSLSTYLHAHIAFKPF